MSLVGNILASDTDREGKIAVSKVDQPIIKEEPALDEFARYVKEKHLAPGFFIYNQGAGKHKIKGVTRFEGISLGISSPRYESGVPDNRALITRLPADRVQALRAGDIVQIVSEDNPRAQGLIFRVDAAVGLPGKACIFARLDKTAKPNRKPIVMSVGFKELLSSTGK